MAVKKSQHKAQPIAPRTAVGMEAYNRVVNGLGLTPPRTPSSMMKNADFPEDLTALDSDELGEQMSIWRGLLNFANYQMTLVGIDVDHIQSQIDDKVQTRIATMRAETVTDKKARANSDPGLKDLKSQLEHGKAAYNLLNSFCEMYSGNYAAISREISRRIGKPLE